MEIRDEKTIKKTDWGIWRQIILYLKTMKKDLLLLAVFVVSLAGLDATWPQLNRIVIDNYIMVGNLDGLWRMGIFYVLFMTVFSIVVWGFILTAARISQNVSYAIRRDGFKRLQELSFSYYDTASTGWLMARLTSDTSSIGDILSWGFVDFGWGILVLVFVTVSMLVVNWQLALLTIAIVPVMAIVSVWFQRKILKQFRKVRKSNSKITAGFTEGITGAVTTKTLVTEADSLKEFSIQTSEMEGASIRAAMMNAVYFPLIMTLGSIGGALVLYFGGIQISAGSLTFGELVLFLSFSRFFFDPIIIMARRMNNLQNAQASAERVITLINTEPEIKDAPEVASAYEDRTQWEEMKGSVQLEQVGFKYKTGETVIEDLSLTIEAGTSVAIVGPTGSGKSTLVNLICRFYEPTSGTIKIDGRDYRTRSLDWLHDHLGYVLQTPQLFSGTIRDNIRYGKLDATDEEIETTSKLIKAHDFIMDFPQGYDTVIGENGAGLSTGQKQLLSFARALIGSPSLLILDEATASIDIETENLLQNAIAQLLKDRTSFIIAHRLSTIVGADLILYLKDGKIVEKGTHIDLLAKKGAYYDLYMGQF